MHVSNIKIPVVEKKLHLVTTLVQISSASIVAHKANSLEMRKI